MEDLEGIGLKIAIQPRRKLSDTDFGVEYLISGEYDRDEITSFNQRKERVTFDFKREGTLEFVLHETGPELQLLLTPETIKAITEVAIATGAAAAAISNAAKLIQKALEITEKVIEAIRKHQDARKRKERDKAGPAGANNIIDTVEISLESRNCRKSLHLPLDASPERIENQMGDAFLGVLGILQRQEER